MFVRQLAAQLGSLFWPAKAVLADQRRVARLQGKLVDFLARLAAWEEHSHGASCSTHASEAAELAALGFQLQLRPSTIPGAGQGVFLTAGSCPEGAILTLYPGLIHGMQDFVDLLACSAADDAIAPTPPPWTLDNHYLLAQSCLNSSFLIDGQPHGLSAQRFAAAAEGQGVPVNTSWLPTQGEAVQAAGPSPAVDALLRQAALGHRFNHGPATASFDLCPLPASPPSTLLRFVPSLCATQDAGTRWVPLVLARASLSAAACGPAELFVDYGTNPLNLGYHP